MTGFGSIAARLHSQQFDGVSYSQPVLSRTCRIPSFRSSSAPFGARLDSQGLPARRPRAQGQFSCTRTIISWSGWPLLSTPMRQWMRRTVTLWLSRSSTSRSHHNTRSPGICQLRIGPQSKLSWNYHTEPEEEIWGGTCPVTLIVSDRPQWYCYIYQY